MARTCGAVIHPVSTSPEEGYFYADRRRIEAEITPRTRAILVTNPGNPTGTVLTHEEMEMLVDVARQHDLVMRHTGSLSTPGSLSSPSVSSSMQRRTSSSSTRCPSASLPAAPASAASSPATGSSWPTL